MTTRLVLSLVCGLVAGAQEGTTFRELGRLPDTRQVRVQRLQEGVPVWGSTLLVPLAPDGRPQLPDLAPLPVAEGPRMDAEAAITRVLADLALPFQALSLTPPTAESILFPSTATGGIVHVPGPVPDTFRMDLRRSVIEEPPAEAYVPAFLVRTRHWDPIEGFITRDTVVEARTGRILRKDPGLRFAAEKAPGRGLFAGSVQLDAFRLADTRFELRDTTRPTAAHPLQDKVLGAGQVPANLIFTRIKEGNEQRFLLFRTTGSFGDGEPFNYLGPITAERLTGINGQTAAVDVAYGVQVTWDLLKNVLQRNGPEGRGGAVAAAVHANVQAFSPYANAFWDPTERTVNFGDGGSGYLPFTSLDVVAHELGHALMTYTADLIYSGESGGLDEATSDMMAMSALSYAAQGANGSSLQLPTGFPWTLGDRLSPAGIPLRSLKRPSRHGNFDGWFDGMDLFGVYQASGPAARFFYYLSAGCNAADAEAASAYLPAGLQGIGIQKAIQIWVRALEAHLQDKATGYAGVRIATEAAASQLFGATSSERSAVENAWAAVNVGPPHGQIASQRLHIAPGPWPRGLGAGIANSSSRDLYVNISGTARLPQVVLEGFPAGTGVTWTSGYAAVDAAANTIRPSLFLMVGWNTSFEAKIPNTPYRAVAMLNPVVLDMDGDGECDASDAAILAIYGHTGKLPSEVFDPASLQAYFPPDPAIYRWNRAFSAQMEVR